MAYSLFETAELGPLISKNRTVRSATNEHLSDPSGQITPAWVDSLEALARGGVGIIITGHLSVDRDQRADEGQAVLDQETDPALLSLAAQRVHQHGALLIAQISHSGGKARPGVNGRPPLSPGDLTPQLLDRLVEQFRHAARTAQMAGFDGVQVHCAHNYLLSSFLNLRWNHREDAYGGSLENRFRLIRRVLLAVRDACGPRFALLVKVDNDSCDDLPALLRLFQSAGVDGIELLQRMKASAELRTIPVVMATAKGAEYDRIRGLDLGADYYLVKPFGVMELVSCVKAVLRRCQPEKAAHQLRSGGLVVDLDAHTVTVDGARVALTYKEFELLRLFLSHPGMAFTRDQLFQEIWGMDYCGETRTVDMHIRTLRQKLGPYGRRIETVRNVGYRMETTT